MNDLQRSLTNLIGKSSSHKQSVTTASQKQQKSSTSESIKTQPNQQPRNKRDNFLHKLPDKQQNEILRWAENQHITPEDPMWSLVDMLGYTRFYSETLPNRIHAAGQHAVEVIASQRQAESEAFAYKSREMMHETMQNMVEDIAQQCTQMNDKRLKYRLLSYGVSAVAGMIALSSTCFVFGYLLGGADLHWVKQPADSVFIGLINILFGLPVINIIVPIMLVGMLLSIYNAFRK